MEYNTIPRPAPTPACPSPKHVQAGFCPCNLYWIETCSRADLRPQAAGSICAPVRVGWFSQDSDNTPQLVLELEMRYDDQLCDSSSDRQCGQLVAPPALYIGSLGTRQAPGTITFPASGQSVSSRQGVLLSCPHSSWACVSRICSIVRRYARSDLGPHILHLFVKKCFIYLWE